MESGARSARGIVQRGGHSINSLPLLSGLPSNPLRPPFDALERTSRVQNFSAPLPFHPRYYLIFFPRDLNSTSLSLYVYSTSRDPEKLKKKIEEIERILGRVRRVRHIIINERKKNKYMFAFVP